MRNRFVTVDLARWAAYIASAMLIFGMFTVLRWTYQSEQVLTFKTHPIPVKQESVKDGGVIQLLFDYCKNSDAQGEIERDLVSKKNSFDFPDSTDPTKATCSQLEASTVLPDIPIHAIPDTYHIEYKITYDLNPLKKNVEVKFKTEDFRIE